MKNLKIGLIVLLMLLLFSNILTGCNEGTSKNNTDENNLIITNDNTSIITDGNKWVLTAEEQTLYMSSLLNEYEERKTEYGYDEYGRLNDKRHIYGNEKIDYSLTKFEYDNNGNVISCTETEAEEGDWYCTFTYDENNNCLSYTKIREYSEGKSTINHTFTYDNNGNILTETDDELYEYKNGGFSRETLIIKYNMKYENGLCVQAEVIVQGEESNEEESYPFSNEYLELYTYDVNGNRINKKIYHETTGNYHIEVNGKYYNLSQNI